MILLLPAHNPLPPLPLACPLSLFLQERVPVAQPLLPEVHIIPSRPVEYVLLPYDSHGVRSDLLQM